MERTAAGKRVARQIVRDTDVSHFRMGCSPQTMPVDESRAANTGSDSQINAIRNIARGAPAGFAQERRIDIGIEGYGSVEPGSDRAREIVILPGRFGRIP